MLRITNLTDTQIDITPNAIIRPRSYLDVQISINPRLYQLVNMGAINIQEIADIDDSKNFTPVSQGSLRRKQMMEKIRNGKTKPSTSLDISSNNQYTEVKTTNRTKNKKIK